MSILTRLSKAEILVHTLCKWLRCDSTLSSPALSLDPADEPDAQRIEARRHSVGLVLLALDDRLEGEVLIEDGPTTLVDGPHCGPHLRVVVVVQPLGNPSSKSAASRVTVWVSSHSSGTPLG